MENPGSSMPWTPTVTARMEIRARNRASCYLSGSAGVEGMLEAKDAEASEGPRLDERLVSGNVRPPVEVGPKRSLMN